MGSKFFINYLRQKWCQINDLYVAVALYWVCRYRLPSAVVDYRVRILMLEATSFVTMLLLAVQEVEEEFNIELYLKVNFLGQGWGYKRPITGTGRETHMDIPVF